MHFVWKTLAAFALTASSACAYYSDEGTSFDGMKVTSISVFGKNGHVSGVELGYLDNNVPKSLHHGSGKLVDQKKLDSGEHVTGFTLYLSGQYVTYIEFLTSGGKSCQGGTMPSSPTGGTPYFSDSQQLAGFSGEMLGDEVSTVLPIWKNI